MSLNTEHSNPFRTYANKIADVGNKNKTHNIIINGVDTHIPNNVPIAIIGDKGSGKTTLLNSIMELTHKNKIYNHIYFVYTTLSLDQELPKFVTAVNVNEAEEFISNLFEIKSIFNSYYKLFHNMTEKQLETLDLEHIDNNIIKYNSGVINSDMDDKTKVEKIISTGERILKTFTKRFKLGSVSINGIHYNDMDLLIIDDMAIASKIIFKRITDNPLYEYFTLTRHMRLSIIMSGQQIEQMPKMLRRETQCWILSKNTNLELLKGVLQPQTLKNIEQKQQQITNQYEFVLYNAVDGSLTSI
jgi:energy-coupling factor transporter ATP-binding protein EcfA2